MNQKDADAMLEQVIEEINRIANPYPVRQEGDIDAKQIRKATGKSENMVRRWFAMLREKQQQPGSDSNFTVVQVYDPNVGRVVWVVRKIDKGEVK